MVTVALHITIRRIQLNPTPSTLLFPICWSRHLNDWMTKILCLFTPIGAGITKCIIFRRLLKELRITKSISRKGNCYDNAVMENLFGKIKSEFIYTQEFERIKQFKQELDEYMRYYNHRRIKEKLKGMSPVQYRTHAVEVA